MSRRPHRICTACYFRHGRRRRAATYRLVETVRAPHSGPRVRREGGLCTACYRSQGGWIYPVHQGWSFTLRSYRFRRDH